MQPTTIQAVLGLSRDTCGTIRQVRAIRIDDVKLVDQQAYRRWLSSRCGGAQDNILTLEGMQGEFALIGSLASYLRHLGIRYEFECVPGYSLASGVWSAVVYWAETPSGGSTGLLCPATPGGGS